MSNFNEHNYLCHYGILGMKWGIRRYQNYDGTYTQQGLERYGAKKKSYDIANERYKSLKKAKASRDEIRNAKQVRKQAKQDVKAAYKRLKNDKLADEGKKYYSDNKRINANRGLRTGLYAATAVSTITSYELLKGQKISTKYGDIPLNKVVASATAVVGLGTSAIVTAKHAREDRRLRAYYGHESYNPRGKSKTSNNSGKRSLDRALKGEERARKEYEPKAAALFKKYPQLYNDFGGPDKIDDWEMFELVVDDYRNGRY